MLTALAPDSLAAGGPASPRRRGWAARLQRFAARLLERCELCGAPLPDEHPHLLDVERRSAACACRPCAIVVGARPDGRFRKITPRAERLAELRMSDADWASLKLPTGLVFLVLAGTPPEPLAFHPGPAGATESCPAPEGWAWLAARNPVLAELAPEVEALLVNRLRGRRDCYLVSIDRCFALIALFRRHWKGMSGGDEIWTQVDAFFDDLARATARGAGHG